MTNVPSLGLVIKKSPEQFYEACRRKGLLMLFQKTSTRTSLSFQSGINQMGGYSVVMDWDSSNFSLSPIRYEARYASRNCDVIMARLKKHADLLELARYSTVPVINGCCDKYHPCQALADLMTIYEVSGTFSGLCLAYVGVHNNVANSLVAGCMTLGIKLLLVTPILNSPSWDEELMQTAYRSGYVEKVDQLSPIHPGFEIEEELIESERSIIYQQAENRMHVQKALLLHLLR
ncbi:ornithine carbamoyltransferase [Paenibacillus oceani]|nr:ornithine carbamoyltransferase [Paenibacillus oceani]